MLSPVRALCLVAVAVPSLAVAQQTRHTLPMQYGSPVPNAPFSAVRTLDFESAAGGADGAPAHAEEAFFRDSAGRTRSELSNPGQLKSINIVDYAAGKHIRWIEGDHVAHTYPLPAAMSAAHREMPAETLPADAPKIEGVPVRHSHTVRGETDATREIVDSWYAPSLRVALLTVIDKGAAGKTTLRFQHIKLGEPAAALFTLPDGFSDDNPNLAPPPPPVSATQHETASAPAQPAPAANAGEGLRERAVVTQAAPAGAEPAYLSDPKFQKALAEAKAARQTPDDRLANWKRANKVAKGQCLECLRQMTLLQFRLNAYKDVVATTEQMEAVATELRDKLFAKAERGAALMRYNYGQPKPEQVTEAEALFSEVLKHSPRQLDVLYLEGRALALLNRDTEARAVFARYVDIAPGSDKLRTRVERFSDDPHLATLALAPPFRLITTDGQQMELDEMNGKVVLLDFWATWCGPCKESLPEIARIAKDYANDPMLVVVSVSQDADESAWRNFVQKNGMTWPQYRDASNALGNAYGVRSIPHFFTIDTNGVLKTEQVGSNADVRSVVADLVKKAHKAEAKKAAETDHGRTGQ